MPKASTHSSIVDTSEHDFLSNDIFQAPVNHSSVQLPSREVEHLNTQLVMYAKDLRRLISSDRQKDIELASLRKKLAQTTHKLTAIGGSVPHQILDKSQQQMTIIGQSAMIQKVVDLCQRVANSTTSILLTGPTGTGKELTAKHIHGISNRREQPFIAVNCGALPQALLESELFGHEKGAFTGATTTKVGLFEIGHQGTLLLDEIGEMPLALQVKLLRVLEERSIRRVGGVKSIDINIRIIAATNRDLKKQISKGKFREDLFYRLNVFPIDMPALSERVSDIPMLVEFFMKQLGQQLGLENLVLTEYALSCLLSYHWPGNIRELRNTIERAILLSHDNQIDVNHLPEEIRQTMGNASEQTNKPTNKSKLAEHERTLIAQALEQTHWNKAAAARKLGISWDNLRYRIKKYGLKKP